LEIVYLNQDIKREYKWEVVVQALGALLTHSEGVTEQRLPE
jgi:hypothetical protein